MCRQTPKSRCFSFSRALESRGRKVALSLSPSWEHIFLPQDLPEVARVDRDPTSAPRHRRADTVAAVPDCGECAHLELLRYWAPPWSPCLPVRPRLLALPQLTNFKPPPPPSSLAHKERVMRLLIMTPAAAHNRGLRAVGRRSEEHDGNWQREERGRKEGRRAGVRLGHILSLLGTNLFTSRQG